MMIVLASSESSMQSKVDTGNIPPLLYDVINDRKSLVLAIQIENVLLRISHLRHIVSVEVAYSTSLHRLVLHNLFHV